MSPTQQKVRDAMRPTKKQTVEQIAEATSLKPITVRNALAALEKSGSVVRLDDGRWRAATLDERHADDVPTGTVTQPEKPARKAPEPLRALVAAHLTGLTDPVSAYTVGKALGRSAGAVQNCIDQLVSAGEAAQTSTKPRLYGSEAAN